MVGPYDKVPKKKALRSLLDFLLKKGVKINVFFRCFSRAQVRGISIYQKYLFENTPLNRL